MKLGKLHPETKVSVDAGASDINILFQKNQDVKIVTDGALSSKHFDEFKKIDSDNYQTENFSEAANKVYINIECGVFFNKCREILIIFLLLLLPLNQVKILSRSNTTS